MFYFNHRYYYVLPYPHDIMFCHIIIIIIIIKARIILYYAERTYLPTPAAAAVFECIIIIYVHNICLMQ